MRSILINKRFLVSSFASTSLLGGGVAVAFLTTKKSNEDTKITQISLKDQLIKKGYKTETKFGPKRILLSQYAGLLDNIGNLESWCKEKEKISEKDDADWVKKFEEICFETIASKIEGTDLVTLKIGDEEGADLSDWNNKFGDFKKAFEPEQSSKLSKNWEKTDNLKNFQTQCKNNERKPFIKENEEIFEEVKKYCTRQFNPSNTHH